MLCLLFSQFAASQSGWVRQKDDYFIKPDYTFYSSANYHRINSDLQITSPFRQKTYSFYFEYGLNNTWAFNGYIPVLKQNAYENTEQVSNIGDIKLELKYSIQKGSFPAALSFAAEFPTGPKELLAKNKTNPLETVNLATGDGDFNLWTIFAISHSFYPKPFYASAYGSYNWRAKFDDQVQAGVEAGYKLKDKFWLISKLSVLTGFGERPEIVDFIKTDGLSYTSFTATGLYEVGKHWGIGFQYLKYNGAIIKLRNTYGADVYSVYLTYNKKR